MGFIRKEIGIGVLISLLATTCGFFIYLQYISESDLTTTFEQIRQAGVLGTALALAAIPNLLVFFTFLKKKQDYRARGVLIGTIFIALLTFILKFI
ncbi:hypothetical protein SAMN04489761_2055 [Tenacibaculum sp. MAR_2009_124]|uniref:hypothetical protein n=1 Tax=Tenacibaculum sp. MAR_2009_124 TaxID=1250059 RepID=UPI00089614A3|nr:hypothetical protein [Tenacibaculum sp. MAR_2009_124]SEB94494.1 hypothetical protein SAMN04489761_2055 [Tenacibaculum sp. MAR_2009_124]